MSRGRPTDFTPELAKEICELLAIGLTLREVCRKDGMPPESTVRGWVLDDREGFSAQYARARELGYQSMADELLDIADDGTNDWQLRQNKDGSSFEALNGEHINRSRLRVDTRKWLLSKALPKIYGDRVGVEHTGKDGDPIQIEHMEPKEVSMAIAHILASELNGVTH